MRKFYFIIVFISLIFDSSFSFANKTMRWLNLPPTPLMLKPITSGYAPVNGIKIWYAIYGHGKPVIMLHGGLANSNYWGNQIPVLAKHYQVIVMDSRGHGRSTRDQKPYSYELMATDVVGLMDYLKITKAALVGWSDGAILGLELAIHHPHRISKLFAFGANSDPSGVKDTANSSVFNTYTNRAKQEYQQLSPTPKQFPQFLQEITKMWATQPSITAKQLKAINIPVWIVDGDKDEGILLKNTEFMAEQIPNAGLLILPQVSHFAFLQDPQLFNDSLINFLDTQS